MPLMNHSHDHGIASIGLAFPGLAMRVETLAELRGADPQKFTAGLGCREIALCAEGEDVATLAVRAARRALERWGGRTSDLGLLVVGTETAKDMSRPLSAFVADELGLRGSIRSFEAKHACYGGTVALRHALEWRASGAARGKAALAIAADVALYAPEDPGEPTQGAGAVAMVIERPIYASIDLASYAYAEPAFDFWRPVGEAYPRVDGKLSLDCYQKATEECFREWLADAGPGAIDALSAACFHVPFPKMVRKAVARLGESLGWTEAQTASFYESKVAPTMTWNQRVGNAYTASLWISVARALEAAKAGDAIAAFSYGSGFGSELVLLRAGERAGHASLRDDAETDLRSRRTIDALEYVKLRERVVPAH